MSEEKFYVVEDDNRLHLAFNDAGKPMWFQTGGNFTATDSVASMWSLKHGGHAVTLVEEPEKVVLSEKQAEIVEDAHNAKRPASYIILKSNDEELLMNAYVNGFTVAKEKKYLVELDGLVTTDGAKQYLTKRDGKWFACQRMPGMHQDFTDEELNKAPEWAQQLDREEVNDDAD